MKSDSVLLCLGSPVQPQLRVGPCRTVLHLLLRGYHWLGTLFFKGLNFSALRLLDHLGHINLNPKHCEHRLVVTNSQESFIFFYLDLGQDT